MELTGAEIRVLGCLIEKGATTPDHYPLSTNALVNACNQKSNREPVVDFDERTVVEAMLAIRQQGLARTNGSGRSDKHRHILPEALSLDQDQIALLAIMMLRGPQSAGELKTRTERYPTSQGFGFESLDDIEAVLNGLAERSDPFVANIGRGPGQSQDRWEHQLGDDDEPQGDDGFHAGAAPVHTEPAESMSEPAPDTAAATVDESLARRVTELEERLARLEAALGV